MMQTKFADTHAHLTDKAFDETRDELIKNFETYGIEKVITSGYNYPSALAAVELANKHENIFASVGIYPENIKELESDKEKLFELASRDKVVAIGEIGLQYTENMPDKEIQKEGFLNQIAIAYELNLPIVIHCRDAYGDMLEILKKNKSLLKYGGTMHCFGGSLEVAEELIKLGLYLSVGGVSTFKNAERLKETLKAVPLNRILLETDCPYLTPHPYRGKLNSPCYIPTIAQNLANLKGTTIEEVAKVTTENAKELFKI